MNLLLALMIFFSSPTDKIKIVDPWMRVGAKGQTTGLFFKIENTSNKPDTLYKVDFEQAYKVQIHETYNAGNDMMGMREVEKIVIPAKSSFELKPGAYHVMLMQLKQDIKKGFVGEFTLYFKQAGKIKIKAEVRNMKIPMKH
ncbi:MAG: copper chaperone PCu(A)C [Ignavibacteriaceae bacterium]